MVAADKLKKISEDVWEIPTDYKPGMNVPGHIFLSGRLIEGLESGALDQTANMATLPGIQKYSMAMPDVHIGYGFPIGGVAAFDLEAGVISRRRRLDIIDRRAPAALGTDGGRGQAP